MNFEGQNISLQDALFVDNITGDIERFRVRSNSVARVLVFPPVNNYHRFLIHKVVEEGFPLLATFSVGVEASRRTIVCFQKHLLDFTLGLGSCSLEGGGKSVIAVPALTQAREGLPPEESNLRGPLEDNEDRKVNNNESKVSNCVTVDSEQLNSTQDTMPEPCGKLEPGDKKDLEINLNKEAREKSKNIEANSFHSEIITITAEESGEEIRIKNCENSKIPPQKGAKDNSPKKRLKRPDVAVYVPRVKRLGGATPTNATQLSANATPFSPVSLLNANATPFCPSVTTSPPSTDVSTNVADTDREEVVPDPVVEEIVKEITVAVGGVQIESPDIDYLSFQTSDASINLDQFGHVIELYDFPEQFKTNDLLNAFKEFTSKWDVKWVDDTHALGVFSSAETAAEALALRHPVIKSRPLNMATKQSKVKAQSVCEYLLPYKPRPATSTAPARRFLSLALGYKVPEASRKERDLLDEARRRKEEDRREDRRKRKEDVGDREEDRRRRREDIRDYDCHDYR